MSFKRVIFIIIGLLILSEVIWATYTLTRPLPASQSTEVGESTASLSLIGPKEATLGQTFKVEINIEVLNTSADGLDLVLKFDPNVLEVVNTPPVSLSTLFPDYPVNSVEEGLITLSAVSSPNSEGFSGQAILGSIDFRAKSSGKTAVTLDYTPNLSTDSNVVETNSGHDILKKVSNLEIIVKN